MKILAIDPCFAALDWYMHCQNDGHQVKVWVKKSDKTKFIGQGIVPLIEDWRDHIKWCDMIFLADNTMYLPQVDILRKRGMPVLGPTAESAEWELDREVGQKILAQCGIETIPSKVFSNYDQAIAYVKKENKRFVSKPSGDADKALSYVSKTPEDMIYMLERWKKASKLKGDFILQEFIPGIEMAVGGWFGPGGFNQGWCENWEFKKLMNDDLGPNTGEQGTVVRYVQKSKLADEMLVPCIEALEKSGHTGYVDVAVIIDEHGQPWPLEFTMRNGYPTFNIQKELHGGDAVEWLMELVEGTDAENIELDTISTGVVIAIPDYPYSHLTKKDTAGIPVYGLMDPPGPNFHPCEMMMGSAPHMEGETIKDKKCLVTAGDYVLVVSGTGETVSQSSKAAYKNIEQIKIPNSPMWRTDIGRRLKKQLPELQKHGYALDMEY